MTDLNEFTNNSSFFSLLSEMKNDYNENYENICLISNEQLQKDHIKLSCNHTFNYEHIFIEIKQQKTTYNNYEIIKLSNCQIKCPYCRKVHKGILPWKKDFPKITFVNWPPKLSFIKKKCTYTFKSGKKKGQTCCKFIDYTSTYCTNHKKILDKRKNKEKVKIQKLTESKNITNDKNISKMTVRDLKQYCKNIGIKKYSKLRKAELLDLIEVHKKNIKNEITIKISPINTNGVDKKKFKHLFEENTIVTI